MYLFISSETGDIDGEEFRVLRNEIDWKLSFLTNRLQQEKLKNDHTYGEEFEEIGIIMMILSPRFDVYKERKLIRFKEKWADIRLKIDYENYRKASKEGKKLLLIKNIVDSIMVVESRKKGDFQGEKLIHDILQALDVRREDLEKL